MHCELLNIGIIKVEGNDALKFLQGQLTCDVTTVTSEQSCMGAHCNPQGRIISLFYLCKIQDNYYLLMERSMVAIAIAALKKYAVFFKVVMTDVSDAWSAIGYQDENIDQLDLPRMTISVAHSRYIILVEAAAIKTAHTNTMTPADWHILNIRDGIPTLYPETSGKFLPHELQLQKLQAVSFDKGCYTGQEIIARMHYRGKLKNQLYVAEIISQSSPQRGADVYSEEHTANGMIVDVCHDVYNNKYHLLIITNKPDHCFLNDDRITIVGKTYE